MEKGRRHLTLKLSSWRFVTNKGDPLVSRSEVKTTVPKERPVSHSGTCKEEERALGFAFVALEEIRLVSESTAVPDSFFGSEYAWTRAPTYYYYNTIIIY